MKKLLFVSGLLVKRICRMNTIYLATIIMQFLFISILNAQVTQEWVSRYNGPGNNEDVAFSIVLDGSGNVYVTGLSIGGGSSDDFIDDYATIKYNSSGVEQWVQRYNGPDNNRDSAFSIAVDGAGNVYVTGCSRSGSTSETRDWATIKYNSAGVEQWVQRYNGPGNGEDWANSIAVDGAGNVYVTGCSRSGSTSETRDWATIKYNSAGVEQWVQRYNGPGNGEDWANSIAVDGSGDVYVTGWSTGSDTDYDYTSIKYDSSGYQHGVGRYNGPGNGRDQAIKIAVDGAGNSYVTGISVGSGTGADYTTIKGNSSGVEEWVQRYNGPGNLDDGAYSLAVDGSGNVYVTGYSTGSGTDRDYATIKYNSAGVEQWVQRYNGPGNSSDVGSSIAVDDLGNVYVTGKSVISETESGYTTIQYNSAGVQQWIQTYNGPAHTGDWGWVPSLAVDTSGNVYVTAYSWGSATDKDYATIKYNSSGVQQWVQTYNGPGNSIDAINSIAVDGSGNVYVTGTSVGDGTDADYATIKYSQAATGVYQTSFDMPENYFLSQNYPNPFNPTTVIKYSIKDAGMVSLKVYNILGQEVATLVNKVQIQGLYEVEFNAQHLTSGIYFYRLTVGSFSEAKKLLLLK